jgi:hypothetical protein
MADRLHRLGCPLLPVLVVSVDTGLPSETIYRRFELMGDAATRTQNSRSATISTGGFFRPDLEGRWLRLLPAFRSSARGLPLQHSSRSEVCLGDADNPDPNSGNSHLTPATF